MSPDAKDLSSHMSNGDLHWIANYIWGIAADVLRDLYVRGKYRDVILPMIVLRRLDAVLEDSKRNVLEMKTVLDQAGVVEQDSTLRQAAGQAFYNTSKFTLRDLRARASRQQLKADFEAYLDGFSPNVQDILENFEFRNQIPRLSKADALGTLIEKLTSPDVNLSPAPVKNTDGSVRHPGLDNHGMGSIFEELVRRFNEENNEEAGEHWTPRDAVRLMAKLVFLPVTNEIKSGTYLLYDGACGTGGMLTVAEETLRQLAAEHGKDVSTHLFGQEINAETYAICKADLLVKGEGDAADNIVGGPEHSTLVNDAFPSREFDFMLSNPPYGKSWKTDLERMGGKKDMRDPRFVIEHVGDPEYSLVTRSSDGQMLFLANKLSKMKQSTPLGSRIAEVHNGSSLFTGDAGQGESNIRRWIIENDWLEAIVALPLNMFYNTGIATYVWVLTNRKPAHRRGKVQLIDATKWFQPLRIPGRASLPVLSGSALADPRWSLAHRGPDVLVPRRDVGGRIPRARARLRRRLSPHRCLAAGPGRRPPADADNARPAVRVTIGRIGAPWSSGLLSVPRCRPPNTRAGERGAESVVVGRRAHGRKIRSPGERQSAGPGPASAGTAVRESRGAGRLAPKAISTWRVTPHARRRNVEPCHGHDHTARESRPHLRPARHPPGTHGGLPKL